MNCDMKHVNVRPAVEDAEIRRLVNQAAARLDRCGADAGICVQALQRIRDEQAPEADSDLALLTGRIEHFRGLQRFCNGGARLLQEYAGCRNAQPLTTDDMRHLLGVASMIVRELKDEVTTCTAMRQSPPHAIPKLNIKAR